MATAVVGHAVAVTAVAATAVVVVVAAVNARSVPNVPTATSHLATSRFELTHVTREQQTVTKQRKRTAGASLPFFFCAPWRRRLPAPGITVDGRLPGIVGLGDDRRECGSCGVDGDGCPEVRGCADGFPSRTHPDSRSDVDSVWLAKVLNCGVLNCGAG